MSSTDHLIQATINKLKARITQKAVDTIDKLALIAEETPEKLKKEWKIFKKEVNEEADRIENESSTKKEVKKDNNQEKIDQIRKKISETNNKVENKIQ